MGLSLHSDEHNAQQLQAFFKAVHLFADVLSA
jgi:hypothetical protein